MRRRLFQLSLFTTLGTLIALLWPISTSALIRVRGEGGKSGYINSAGRIAVEPIWDDVGFPGGELIAVSKESKWGWVDRRGNTVIPVEWKHLSGTSYGKTHPEFDSEGMVLLKRNGYLGWYDRSGKRVINLDWIVTARPFDQSGMAPVSRDRLWGAIDRKGNLRIPIQWDQPFTFDEKGLARVVTGGRTGWIDTSGKVVIDPKWDAALDFGANGLAAVRKGNHWGCIDKTGALVIPTEWDAMRPFDKNGFAVVSKAGNWGWIDREGMFVGRWDSIGPFDESGMAPVERGEKWGWVRSDLSAAIPPKWDFSTKSPIDPFAPPWENVRKFDANGWLGVRHHGKCAWIDRTGKLVLETGWLYSGDFDESGRASVSDARRLAGWIDRTGKLAIRLEGSGWSEMGDPLIWPRHEYYVASMLAPPSQFRILLAQIGLWFGRKVSAPRLSDLCHVYDKNGTLIWSSTWLRFETKCYIILGGALLFALLTRPKRRATGHPGPPSSG